MAQDLCRRFPFAGKMGKRCRFPGFQPFLPFIKEIKKTPSRFCAMETASQQKSNLQRCVVFLIPDDSGAVEFDPAGGVINGNPQQHETVKFYRSMCPVYDWTGPSYSTESGAWTTSPNTTKTNLEVTLRQFAFEQDFDGFYYQCEVILGPKI